MDYIRCKLTKTSQRRYILDGTPLVDECQLICLPEGRHMVAKSHTPTRKQRTRGFSRYRRSETSRLLKGAADAGLTVRSFEVDPVTGALRVFVGKESEPS